jgi:hypothetical protein
VFGEEFEDVFVLLVGEGFAEGPHVFEERFDRFLEGKGLVFFSRGGAKPLAILAPFDEDATAGRPLDANILRRVKTSKGWANVALKRNVKR